MKRLTRFALVGAATAVLALGAGCHAPAADQPPPATARTEQPTTDPGDQANTQLDQLQSTLDNVQSQLDADAKP